MKFEDKPFIAIWETTQACDLVCKHCRASARPERDAAELSTSEGFALLDTFADEGVPLVILTGGDPAKRPDLVELVAHGAGRGLSMGLTPSATPLLTQELLAELKAAGLARLAMSIDGATPHTHDSFRGRDGSFERTVQMLRAAHDLGLPTQVNTTLHAGTLPHLQALSQMMGDLQIRLWSVFVMVPTGRARLDLLPTADDVEAALLELAEISRHSPFAVKTTAGCHYRRVALQEKKRTGEDLVIGARGKQAMWVSEGRGFLFVSHRGDVFPSGFLPVPCGNVRALSPLAIYRDHPTFRLLRDSEALLGKCRACSYRTVCGGSRARAFAMKGDLMAADPLCAYVPPGYDGPTDIFQGISSRGQLPVLQPSSH